MTTCLPLTTGDPKETRSHSFNVLLTPTEYHSMSALSAQYGISKGALTRLGLNSLIEKTKTDGANKKDLPVEILLPPILASRLNVEMKIHWWWLLQTS